MTNEAILRQLAEKERQAKINGIKSMVMDLRMILDRLKVIKLRDSSFDSERFIVKHSPIFKKKV